MSKWSENIFNRYSLDPTRSSQRYRFASTCCGDKKKQRHTKITLPCYPSQAPFNVNHPQKSSRVPASRRRLRLGFTWWLMRLYHNPLNDKERFIGDLAKRSAASYAAKQGSTSTLHLRLNLLAKMTPAMHTISVHLCYMYTPAEVIFQSLRCLTSRGGFYLDQNTHLTTQAQFRSAPRSHTTNTPTTSIRFRQKLYMYPARVPFTCTLRVHMCALQTYIAQIFSANPPCTNALHISSARR